MSGDRLQLDILLVEDDQESLKLLVQTLPDTLCDCLLHYDPINRLEDIPDRLKWRRYDMVLTDIYKDPPPGSQKIESDIKAGDIVRAIRQHRFCPIVLFTDGSFPSSLVSGPFVKLVTKTKNDEIVDAMKGFLASGIPQIAKRMHDELDEAAGPRYLWPFLESNWNKLESLKQNTPVVIERLIRRRASFQFRCLDPDGSGEVEISQICAPDFYLMPPVGKAYRLGSILRRKHDQSFEVVLTPHCYLETQPDAKAPRADHVLLVATIPAVVELKKSSWETKAEDRQDQLRRRIQSPAQLGTPRGRFWFLPGFLDIPDLYCDLLQVHSVAYDSIEKDHDFVAVLDAPYAEALQSCFTSLYSSVGVPTLDPKQSEHLIPKDKE